MAKWTYIIPISLIFFRACKRIQKIQGFGERFIETTPFLPGKVFTHFNWKGDLAIWLSGYRAIWLSGYLAIWRRAWRGGATAKFDFGGRMDYVENRAASPDPPPPPYLWKSDCQMRAKSDCPTQPLIHPRKTVSRKRISVTQVLATHRLPSPSSELVNIMSVVRWASAKAYDVWTCVNMATPKTAAVSGGRRSAAVGGGRRRSLRKCLHWRRISARCRTVKQALRGETNFSDVTKQLQTPMPQHPSTAALTQPQHRSTAAPQHPSTAAPQHPSTAAPQHPSTAAPQHRSTAAPQHRSTPIPSHPDPDPDPKTAPTPLKSTIPTTYITYITTLHRRDLRNAVTQGDAVQHLSVGVSCPFKPPNKQILSLHRNPPNSFTHHRLTHL